MNILFIHQNFPAQFKHLAPALAAEGHHVVAISHRKHAETEWKGVQLTHYELPLPHYQPHPWLIDFSTKFARAQAAQQLAFSLKKQGFEPDFILAHPGWGESLFIKDVWPQAKLALYCEFHYQAMGADVGFDPEFPTDPVMESQRILLKNINHYLHYEQADAGISPTLWQANSFPKLFRQKIEVIHDGIDTQFFSPKLDVQVELKINSNQTLRLSRKDKIVTFSARNLEPYRGFHSFMRALPKILKGDPEIKILIIGEDGVSYGNPSKTHTSWRAQLIDEIQTQMNPDLWSRVFFLGRLNAEHYRSVLQLSRLHIYLTYPFVLSWGLLEAMSCGCEILVSNTAPLHEIIDPNNDDQTFSFFNYEELASKCLSRINHTHENRYSFTSRDTILSRFKLDNCLKKQKKWVYKLL